MNTAIIARTVALTVLVWALIVLGAVDLVAYELTGLPVFVA